MVQKAKCMAQKSKRKSAKMLEWKIGARLCYALLLNLEHILSYRTRLEHMLTLKEKQCQYWLPGELGWKPVYD